MLAVASLLAFVVQVAGADEPAGKKVGALVIVGGGTMPDSVREAFMTLAGGKEARLVVVPTASSAADDRAEDEGYLTPWRKYAPASLTLLHTRSRSRADEPAFFKPIEEATAVWFSGGDQVKLIEAYRGTATDRAFKALLARGGVIGGTSAGAAVMSDVMIEGGMPKATVGRGFGFVTNAVVDQHFLRRSRVNRLLGVLAERPHLIGLGIDEGTALILQGDRWRVVGRSYVLACQVGPDGKPDRFESLGDGDSGTYPASGLPVRAAARKGQD